MDNQQQNQSAPNSQTSGFLKQLEDFFDTYLHKKAPFHLPPKVKEWIVKFGPWIILVLMILTIPVILAVFSLSAILVPFAASYAPARFHTLSLIAGVINLIVLIMEAVALPGLFSRSLKGWRLLYNSVLVGAVAQLLEGNVISLIISVAISMYFLFEVKEYYK